MKLLKNKFVVGVLGIVAIVIVANNLGVFKSSKKVIRTKTSSEQSKILKSNSSNKVVESNNCKNRNTF